MLIPAIRLPSAPWSDGGAVPDAGHLFDRGFISFEDSGAVLVSPVVHRESLRRMGLEDALQRNVGGFSEGQRSYLAFHRDSVFLQSRLRR